VTVGDPRTAVPPTAEAPPAPRRADCGQCLGLCCVGPAFRASADFAIDKPARTPCPNLRRDALCGIHSHLRGHVFGGCVVFDCFGAGQQTVQVTFGGGTQRHDGMLTTLEILRPLHEVLWYLDEAVSSPAHGAAAGALRTRVEAMVRLDAASLGGLDVTAVRREAGDLFDRISTEARAGLDGPDHRGADLIGADLRVRHLRGARLRGAYLVGSDLRAVDLHRADLLGADLRGADLRGARLADALFVTGPQLESARGDRRTTVPARLTRPGRWT
jgi:hypothetical protein